MRRRQPLPRLWLMTDERQGERLFDAVGRLPKGSGIIFRHYSLPESERRTLFERVRQAAKEKGQLLLLGGSSLEAQAWGADGSHGRGRGFGLRSAPAHDPSEIRAAERAGADLLFLSPVFATHSHPGAKPMGPGRFTLLARSTNLPVIALGGMNEARFRTLRGAYGWAAIDAWG